MRTDYRDEVFAQGTLSDSMYRDVPTHAEILAMENDDHPRFSDDPPSGPDLDWWTQQSEEGGVK